MDTPLQRREFLQVAGLVGLSQPRPPDIRSQPRLPNIVLILADDLGYGDLGCYGATKVKTPNADRLASEGCRFTDAHSPSAVCSPTRYGVLTGRYPWRAGVLRHLLPDAPLAIRPGEVTLPSLLKSAGYATGAVGKWHLGFGETAPDWNGRLAPGPNQVGFDYYFGVPTSNNYPPFVYVENDRVVGKRESEVIRVEGLEEVSGIAARRVHEEIGDHLTAKAAEFIERNGGRPFFLYLATCTVHEPITPALRFRGSSQAGLYGDFIHEFDWTVGEVLKTLDRLKLAGQTLLILTSDNGAVDRYRGFGHQSCGYLRGQNADIHEGGHRVPFIARWPGRIKTNSTSDEVICHTDLLATAAAIAGIDLAPETGPDSYNILPALLGRKHSSPIREATIHVSQGATHRAIRQGPWKLVFQQGTGGFTRETPSSGAPPGQLYNLKDDIRETRNLYHARRDLVKQLTGLYETYVREGRSRPPFNR